MPYEYYAENHDWDMALLASSNLLMTGQAADSRPLPAGSESVPFSCFTGSMLLAFSAVESFTTSIAFLLSRDTKFSFNYSKYKKTNAFWAKLEMVFTAIELKMKKESEIILTLERMREWRNNLVHADPYSIETSVVLKTQDSTELHENYIQKDFPRHVNSSNAVRFYNTAVEYIQSVKRASGLSPAAMCQYRQIP